MKRMDNEILHGLLNATQRAATASYDWIGLGDSKAADCAAGQGMREAMNAMDFDGRIVIGEGERDEAPMLYIGEKLGKGGNAVDIAVDPLEGTDITARGDYGSLSVLASASRGMLLQAPDTYMEKIVAGPGIGRKVSLALSAEENVKAAAHALQKPVGEIRVTVLDRDRHKELIASLRKTGCRVILIRDGDVHGAIGTCMGTSDLLMGIGGAPEGVLAASAIKSMGGYMEGKMIFRNADEIGRAKKHGTPEAIINGKIMPMDDMVKDNKSVFIASGVTEGTFLKGVKKSNGAVEVHSVIIRAGSVMFVKNSVRDAI